MSNKRIRDLTEATSIGESDLFEIEQSGTSKQATASLISGTVKVASITLTNDQIKALPTLSVPIIAPTETLNLSGFPLTLPKIISAVAVIDTTAGAYTVDGTGSLFFQIGDPSVSGGIEIGRSVQFVASNPSFMGTAGIGTDLEETKRSIHFFIPDIGMQTGQFVDNGIYLYIDNSGSDLTDGHAANTMKVIVYYTVIEL